MLMGEAQMIGSIAAVVVFIAAGLAFSAWSIRARGRRLRHDHELHGDIEPPPLMSDLGAEGGNRNG
jgi:hypothetical protein